MELMKQTESRTSANTQEEHHSDHVGGIPFYDRVNSMDRRPRINAPFILIVSLSVFVSFVGFVESANRGKNVVGRWFVFSLPSIEPDRLFDIQNRITIECEYFA